MAKNYSEYLFEIELAPDCPLHEDTKAALRVLFGEADIFEMSLTEHQFCELRQALYLGGFQIVHAKKRRELSWQKVI